MTATTAVTRKTRGMCRAQRCRNPGEFHGLARWCDEHWAKRRRKGQLYRLRSELLAVWAARGIKLECIYCGGAFQDVDHFVPRALGGSDDFANLLPSCAACNQAKGASAPDPQSIVDWLLDRVES